jgi:hypothetical protein
MTENEENDSPLAVEVGDMFWAPRDVYDPKDPEEGRPLLVVQAPTEDRPEVVVRTRTSKTKTSLGRAHPAEPRLGLQSPGRIQPHEYHIDHSDFTEANGVERLGQVREDILRSVLRDRSEGF